MCYLPELWSEILLITSIVTIKNETPFFLNDILYKHCAQPYESTTTLPR